MYIIITFLWPLPVCLGIEWNQTQETLTDTKSRISPFCFFEGEAAILFPLHGSYFQASMQDKVPDFYAGYNIVASHDSLLFKTAIHGSSAHYTALYLKQGQHLRDDSQQESSGSKAAAF